MQWCDERLSIDVSLMAVWAKMVKQGILLMMCMIAWYKYYKFLARRNFGGPFSRITAEGSTVIIIFDQDLNSEALYFIKVLALVRFLSQSFFTKVLHH